MLKCFASLLLALSTGYGSLSRSIPELSKVDSPITGGDIHIKAMFKVQELEMDGSYAIVPMLPVTLNVTAVDSAPKKNEVLTCEVYADEAKLVRLPSGPENGTVSILHLSCGQGREFLVKGLEFTPKE